VVLALKRTLKNISTRRYSDGSSSGSRRVKSETASQSSGSKKPTLVAKRCYICRRFKVPRLFHRRRKSPDGLMPMCKVCNYKRTRGWITSHIDRSRTYQKNYHAAHAADARLYSRLSARRYAAAHRETVRNHARLRRALLRGTSPSLVPSDADIKSRIALFRNRCAYCLGPYEALDHLWPLSRAGLHVLTNLYPACRSCNSRKNAQLWYDWYVTQPFFSKRRMRKIMRLQIVTGLEKAA
jgi:5-methylcytosine-specific restriction endonuclease McrA